MAIWTESEINHKYVMHYDRVKLDVLGWIVNTRDLNFFLFRTLGKHSLYLSSCRYE